MIRTEIQTPVGLVKVGQEITFHAKMRTLDGIAHDTGNFITGTIVQIPYAEIIIVEYKRKGYKPGHKKEIGSYSLSPEWVTESK